MLATGPQGTSTVITIITNHSDCLMPEPTTGDWLKYYMTYGKATDKAAVQWSVTETLQAWVKTKLAGQYTFAVCCTPCTCGMSAMATDSDFWSLPRRPDEVAEDRGGQRSEEDGHRGQQD